MSSIIDKLHQKNHLRHFVVQTRTFQIEKARNVDMYENLRNYIIRQNEKRKQEMEMSEELKRAKREKELKHKRDKLTLDEIKEQISKQENKLNELENEKHRLFAEFKKVLNEDENRKSIQRQKESAPIPNITFGPVVTSSATSQKPPAPTPSVPSTTHSAVFSNSLHQHVSQSTQPIYFAQPHVSMASAATSVSSVPNSYNQHRINGRVPTPTSASFAIPKSQTPQPSGYSKSLPPPSHLSAPLSLTSMSSSPVSIPSSSIASASIPSPFQIQNERHRLSYKRTHDQTSSSPVNLQSSVVPVPGTNASHLPYLANYKSALSQQSMHPPPGAFSSQLSNQHVLPQPGLELQNHPFYHSLINYSVAMANQLPFQSFNPK